MNTTKKARTSTPAKNVRRATPTHNLGLDADRVALWSPNNPVTPDQVHPGTGAVYEFVCPKGPDHVWSAAVKSLTGANTGCPACTNKQLSVTNRLDILHPSIAEEWHPTRNGNQTAADYVHGSGATVYWLCRQRGHTYPKPIVKRTRLGQGCPQCRVQDRSVAVVAAHLVPEWCHDANGDLTPETVAAGSTTPVIWRCIPKGHRWPASPDNRRRGGTRCPDCSNVRATPEYNLATEHPDVADGYHPDLNTTPVTEVHPRSETPRYFTCQTNTAHVWLAQPAARTRTRSSGCPVCNLGGWTVAAVTATLAAMLVDGTVEDLTATERAVVFHTLGFDQVTDTDTRTQLARFVAGAVTLDDVYLAVGNDPEELARVKDIRSARAGHADLADLALPVDEDGLRALDAETGSPFEENPGAEARAILRPLASTTLTSLTLEGQTLDTLLHTRVDALWRRVVVLPADAAPIFVAAVAEHLEGPTESLQARVAALFCDEYAACTAQPLPADWKSSKTPLLMQKLTAHRVEANRRVANWSGTGAGKTISALLAAGVIGADLTVVFCPNGVIDTWSAEIREVYPDAAILTKTLTPDFDAVDEHADMRFLLLNFEMLQQSASRARLEHFLAQVTPAFVVVDELHNVKQRAGVSVVSQRKELLGDYLAAVADLRPGLAVLAMTATPVLNDLHEARSLVELVTGAELPELGTRATIANAYAVYAALARVGLRLSGKREPFDLVEVSVDITDALDEVAALGPLASISDIESVLVRKRLPAIIDAVHGPTLVYTHYVSGVVPVLVRGLRDAGFSVGEFTGANKTGLNAFKAGDVDVLVASAPVSTGIDGLQHVSHNLVVSCPPWTWSETEQLIGRLARQGQTRGTTRVTVPVTSAVVGDEEWSWDGNRLARLKFKRQLAEAAVDGIVADEHDVPVDQVNDRLLERLAVLAVRAEELVHPPTVSTMVARSHDRSTLVGPVRRTSPFSRMNQLMNRSHSSRTGQRFEEAPSEFFGYHDKLDGAREGWEIDPLLVAIEALRAVPGAVVGDFGCGPQPRIAQALAGVNVVHSFDHVAGHGDVVAGDMRSTPLGEGVLDVAVFCQSLMGSNCADYLREAHRVLATGGLLAVWEQSTRVRPGLAAELSLLGFDEVVVESHGRFTQVRAVRGDRTPPTWAALTLGRDRSGE